MVRRDKGRLQKKYCQSSVRTLLVPKGNLLSGRWDEYYPRHREEVKISQQQMILKYRGGGWRKNTALYRRSACGMCWVLKGGNGVPPPQPNGGVYRRSPRSDEVGICEGNLWLRPT